MRTRSFAMFLRSTLITITFVTTAAYGQLEFLSDRIQPHEVDTFAAEIMRQIPNLSSSSSYSLNTDGVANLLRSQLRMESTLRADAQYMKAAKKRPPLEVYSFSYIHTHTTYGQGFESSFQDLVNAEKQSPTYDRLQEKIIRQIQRWPKNSSHRLFSGLLTFLNSPTDKKLVVSSPQLSERFETLMNASQEGFFEILKNEFESERFGIARNRLDRKTLAQKVKIMDHFERVLAARLEAWCDQSSLSFFLDGHKDCIDRITSLLPTEEPELEILRKRLAQVVVNHEAAREQEVVDDELIIRELPPYMAILRGAIGHDCSTERSWPYPNSPYERNYWIENPSGRVLGYISGNITTVNGKPNLYIRDIVGPDLNDNHFNMIVAGFFRLLPHFGLKQMTLMHGDFTGNNPIERHRTVLKGLAPDDIITQTFSDEYWRDYHFRPAHRTDGTYDGMDKHTYVRTFKPNDGDLSRYRAKVISPAARIQDEPPVIAKEDLFWNHLPEALHNGDATDDIPQDLIDAILNKELRSIDDFYEEVKERFKDAGHPLSQNLAHHHEYLFFNGHLAAPDAFTHSDPKVLRQTMRILRFRIMKEGIGDQALQLISENPKVIEESKVMVDAFKALFSGGSHEDVDRLTHLYQAGLRFKQIPTTPEELEHIVQATNSDEFALDLIDRIYEEHRNHALSTETWRRLGHILDNENSPSEKESERVASLLFDNPIGDSDLRTEIKTSVQTEDNIRILYPLSVVYLRPGDVQGKTAKRALRTLRSHLNEESLPQRWREEAAQLLELPAYREMQSANTELKDQCESDLE